MGHDAASDERNSGIPEKSEPEFWFSTWMVFRFSDFIFRRKLPKFRTRKRNSGFRPSQESVSEIGIPNQAGRLLATSHSSRKDGLHDNESAKSNRDAAASWEGQYMITLLKIPAKTPGLYGLSIAKLTEDSGPWRRVALSSGPDCNAVWFRPSAYEDSYKVKNV